MLCVVAVAAAMTVAAIAGMNFNFNTYCQPGAYLTHTSERILRSNTEKKIILTQYYKKKNRSINVDYYYTKIIVL